MFNKTFNLKHSIIGIKIMVHFSITLKTIINNLYIEINQRKDPIYVI